MRRAASFGSGSRCNSGVGGWKTTSTTDNNFLVPRRWRGRSLARAGSPAPCIQWLLSMLSETSGAFCRPFWAWISAGLPGVPLRSTPVCVLVAPSGLHVWMAEVDLRRTSWFKWRGGWYLRREDGAWGHAPSRPGRGPHFHNGRRHFLGAWPLHSAGAVSRWRGRGRDKRVPPIRPTASFPQCLPPSKNYIVGLNPTNAASLFRTIISFDGGSPIIFGG